MKRIHHHLLDAMQAHKVPQVIVGYLKLQQAATSDFFTLLLDRKINGRLFYNTCLPNGSKEIRFGNETFQADDFQNAIDELLEPFQQISIQDVHNELDKPAALTQQMQQVIQSILTHIETSAEWKKFWEKEIHLTCTEAEKKSLYHTIAGAAAFKVLVSCIDRSQHMLDPRVKRNVALLVQHCTNTYQSIFLHPNDAFKITATSNPVHASNSDFGVFKAEKKAAPRRRKRAAKHKVQVA